MSNGRKIRRTRRKSIFLPFLVMTLVSAIAAGGLAYGWQSIEDRNATHKEEPYSPSRQQSSQESVSSSSEEAPSAQPPVSSSEPEPQPTTLVEEGERVRSDYFNDAVFIGDSITTGIQLYGVLPDSHVLASTGINLQSILTAEAIERDGSKMTILQALETLEVSKIYIMLGANGLAFLGADTTVEYYRTFLEEVLRAKPDCTIYIQSIFPIDEAKFAERYQGNLKNTTIVETNEKLLALAEEKGVYYVNPAEAFLTPEGALLPEATPDGLHFNSDYYTKWIDYLKTHAIPVKNT